MSDLHLQFYPGFGRDIIAKLDPEPDTTLVLAGDVLAYEQKRQSKSIKALEAFFKRGFKNIIFVPGNHEFWYTDIDQGLLFERKLKDNFPKLTILTRNAVEIVEGQRFLGDTFWYTWDPMNPLYEDSFPDFKHIRGIRGFAYQQNQAFREMLRVHCRPDDVVITHHVPTDQSTAPRFKGDVMNRFFVSPVDAFIQSPQGPKLWIHGHTHDPYDYVLGKTRILCNPRGYPGEPSMAAWNPNLVVEL